MNMIFRRGFQARSTADLVVRPTGTEPGNYFHVTKVTQEKQVILEFQNILLKGKFKDEGR